ncbi:MAG: hypothetical protein WHV44_11825 [Anaerolineales bacterium]
MTTSRFYFRVLPAMLLLFILVAAVYAFAATNTVPESGAGDGSGVVSGYTVSNITYTPNASNPSTLDSVSFSLTPTGGAGAPTVVRASVDNGTTWSAACTLSGTTWTCNLGGAAIAPITSLRIIATQ